MSEIKQMRLTQGFALLATVLVVAGTVSAATGDADVPRALLDKAAAAGAVRVLVQLKVADRTDAAAVAAAKQAVLAEVGGTRHRVVRELPGLLALALDASAETLRALASSPLVERVVEDVPRRPLR
jgi:hypothetical protein